MYLPEREQNDNGYPVLLQYGKVNNEVSWVLLDSQEVQQ